MKTQPFMSATVLGCAFALGLSLALNSWEGRVFVSLNRYDSRSPAAIKKAFDFSQLEGSALRNASQHRLVTDARVINESERVGIELGHFLMRDEAGNRTTACGYYNQMELKFVAEGMAQNGDPIELKITGPCSVKDKDLNRMDPLYLPVSEILKEEPRTFEFPSTLQPGVRFSFSNIATSWPRTWILVSVKMYQTSEEKPELLLGDAELRHILKRPIKLVW